jgi:ABC-type multidrug transport system ATPase subunit
VNAALELRGVVKCYGRRRALDGLDLTVPRGSIFGLVGSNGAGKTTAMAVAVGLLQSQAGTINLLEAGAFHSATHAGRVTLLPQDCRFPGYARVEELLRYYGRLQGVPAATLETNITGVLDWVHLQDRRQVAVRTLSHGMTRRLAIAQAFLGEPELVLLDEPLNGLDPREAARVRDLIRERRGRQAIVISSHQLTDIEALCDHVAFIEHGQLVRQDKLEAIVRRAQRLTYHVTGAPVPLAQLAAAWPAAKWESQPGELRVTFPEDCSTEQFNAQVLPVLLAAGVGILAIHRGSDLESEYLRLANTTTPL